MKKPQARRMTQVKKRGESKLADEIPNGKIKETIKCPKSQSDDVTTAFIWYGGDNCCAWWHRHCLPPYHRAHADLSCMLSSITFHCPLCSEN